MKKSNPPLTKKTSDFTYSLPAIRAIQADQEYFTTVIPFGIVAKLLSDQSNGFDAMPFDRERMNAITAFITENPQSYVLPALTISIRGEYVFQSSQEDSSPVLAGTLVLPINSKIQIHDGRHRASAIAQAIAAHPTLSNQSISVVIFPIQSRNNRKFGAIKANERKSGRLERIISDKTDNVSQVTREVIRDVDAFTHSIEMVKTTISNRSKNLFTFSALYQANEALLSTKRDQPIQNQIDHAVEFWKLVQNAMPDWKSDRPRVELRKQTVHAHSVTLCAIAVVGAAIVARFPNSWQRKLTKLHSINWSRGNTKLWEGKAMLGGRMIKSTASIELTARVIADQLGVSLTS
jgi:DNA sulfur modification protein DndB